ncbi:cell division cycle-associated protein 7-like [Capsicum chacoense]|uniref:Zinc-finger domain-containing protein n=1 Tax=Capsicum annuum TaxID=4072 RepID=A0A1U8FVC4_CAPAN|nr:putative dnaJ -like protein subfamily A member 3, mitochondrial-like [Capsicum annuum]PHT88591.1 hypothetical protein T459_10697 [Capsicum annuum]
MGRLGVKSDYEELRKAQILENQARLASLGVQIAVPELRSTASKPRSEKRKYNKVDYFSTPLRRSIRLKGNNVDSCGTTPSAKRKLGLFDEGDDEDEIEKRPASAPYLRVKSDYEELRKAQILENQARLASLGVRKAVVELRSTASKPRSEKRKYNKVDYFSAPLRRSSRLKGNNVDSCGTTPPAKRKLGLFDEGDDEDDIKKRPANAPHLRVKYGLVMHLSPEALARRCNSKERGTIYDPILGICCHFCRQKKLCGEEDCKRCGDSDMDQPCLGKTDCSICHSSKGVLCRGCLKNRYGEEMEDVRDNKEWICPHCTEQKGINPYWICNSSLCLKKRKMAPTGIAIFRAREMGYKSVAHLLMDQLQGTVKSI